MADAAEIFARFLAGKGLRLTRERRLILEVALALEGHFGIDELHERLRRRKAPVHRATIYRILPSLVECGLVRKILHGERGAVRYEHVIGHPHHYHLACVECGKIIEFRQPAVARALEETCRRHRFSPIERRLCIRGYCPKCGDPPSPSGGPGRLRRTRP